MSIDKYIAKLGSSKLLSELEVKNLTQSLIELLFLEPNVVEVDGEQYVLGDIHGQFYDLTNLFNSGTSADIHSAASRRAQLYFLGRLRGSGISFY